MRISPVIFGCKSETLSQEEQAFFREVQPWGFILFARNVERPEQVARLVEQLRNCVDHDDVAVLIDQEGGRVRRLRPPHWAEYHSGAVIGRHYADDAQKGRRIAWLQSRLMAFDFEKLGINVDCLPVLDVPVPGAHDVIGDRAYGQHPDVVADLGKASAAGLMDGGILPVMKHIPGHGRSMVDSHHDLPRVSAGLDLLNATDFEPFKQLAELPLAMTAHVIYESVDPTSPATTSAKVISEIIRGKIGFDGLLMCDDLSMRALSGDFATRTQSSFAAGCDVVLHCNGEMNEMRLIAEVLPAVSPDGQRRIDAASACWGYRDLSEEMELREEFEGLCNGSEYLSDPTEAMA